MIKRVFSLVAVLSLQAIGSAAAFGGLMLIARQRGAEIQGTFGLVKAEVDLLAAVLLLGMPQAIFYFLHRGALSWTSVRRLAGLHTIGAAAATVAFQCARDRSCASFSSATAILAIAVAVAALVAHGNLRGGLLSSRSVVEFSAVTALPGTLLLLVTWGALSLGGLQGSRNEVGLILAGAYVAALACTVVLAPRNRNSASDLDRSPGVGALSRYGIATWIPAVAQNLSPVIALTWIDRRLVDAVGVGIFSAALLALNLVLTPIAMIVPLLFKRWVAADSDRRWSEAQRILGFLGILCVVLAAIAWIVEVPAVSAFFGPEYLSRGHVFAVLSLGLWPQATSRVFGVVFSAAGRPWLAVAGEIARVATLGIGLIVFQVNQLVTLACLWVAAEFVSPTVGWFLSRNRPFVRDGALP